MRFIKSLLASIALLVFLSSCGGGKTVVGSTNADATLSVANLVASHNAAFPNFKTLASRALVRYDDGKREQSIAVSIRMEKDKVIWLKASILGITMAKAKITPERVSFYETLGNTYFDGDFALISDWLGTDLNFEQTQAILLGQSIFQLGKSYRSNISENKYKLSPKEEAINFIHSLMLHPDSFKVHSASVSQPIESRFLSLKYGPYQEKEGSFYPSEISIKSTDGNKNTHVSLTYRKIDLNVSVKFPFTIPQGYEEIKLSK